MGIYIILIYLHNIIYILPNYALNIIHYEFNHSIYYYCFNRYLKWYVYVFTSQNYYALQSSSRYIRNI